MDNNLLETLNLCNTKFYSELALNKQKYDYYQDKHDIQKDYKTQDRRSNQIAQCNFVGVFIDQETSYILGKPVSLVPKNGDENIIMDIDYNLAHWSRKHNQTLCTDLGIYGKVFELYYVNQDGEFCARVLNSKNAYAVIDENNIVTLFIYFYRKPFDFNEYVDVYTPNEKLKWEISDEEHIQSLLRNKNFELVEEVKGKETKKVKKEEGHNIMGSEAFTLLLSL